MARFSFGSFPMISNRCFIFWTVSIFKCGIKGSFKICLPIAMYYLAVLVTNASIDAFLFMFREIGAYEERTSNPTTKVTKAMIICFFVMLHLIHFTQSYCLTF
jgi:hypothetical protein